MTGRLFARSSRAAVFGKHQGCFLLPCSCSVTVRNLTHLPVPEPGGARCLGARVGFWTLEMSSSPRQLSGEGAQGMWSLPCGPLSGIGVGWPVCAPVPLLLPGAFPSVFLVRTEIPPSEPWGAVMRVPLPRTDTPSVFVRGNSHRPGLASFQAAGRREHT